MSWKPAPKKELSELSGPIKRIAPKGLLTLDVARQIRAPDQDSRSIVCGKCHAVIYNADKGFDTEAFQEARKRHYSISPACEEQT